MQKKMKRVWGLLVIAALVVSMLPAGAKAAPKVKLSKKNLTVKVGKKVVLKVKKAKKKAKWSIKKGKKYISLSKKKKKSVTIKGKKAGKAVVQAKIGKKKLTCNVTVKKAKKKSTKKSTPTPAPSKSPVENNTPTPTPTATPTPITGFYEGLDSAWIRANIDPEKPMVAMSFDDGPGGYSSFVNYGMQIQESLRAAGAHATFFYVGSHIARDANSRAEVKQAVDYGFEIANHSYDTEGLNINDEALIAKKINDTNALLTEISGYTKFLFRAPNVAYSDAMYKVIDAPFIDVSNWSNDYQGSVTKDDIVTNVCKAKDGDIINMHSVHEKTAQAVPEILAYFAKQGIQVVSVSELFAIRGKTLESGKKYYSCPK